MDARYKNPDDDPRGPWASDNPLRREYREYAYYEIITPSGRSVFPPPGSSWRFNKEEVPQLIAENRLWFGKDGKGVPRIKRFLSEVKSGLIPQSIWSHDDVGNTQEAKKEVIRLNSEKIFDTPKPERLIRRIIDISTLPGDIVLDSFLGSGTTAAVAHKMGRRYIGIELGEHAVTHCVPRIKKVVDGEQGGISKALDWQGGGGFRFYRLGEPVFDETNRINPLVTYSALAAHVWFSEAHSPLPAAPSSPLLGIHNGTAYYLLFNGILGDRRPEGGNVLTQRLLRLLPPFTGPRVIYGEVSLLDEARLRAEGITFKKIPYELAAR